MGRGDTERGASAGSRFGYVIAVAVNAVLLWVVLNLSAWHVLPFLTDDFDRVVGAVGASLIAAMVVNAAWLWSDRGSRKPLGNLVQLPFSLFATIELYQVFPFDLARGWELLFRFVLIVAGAGTVIGIIANLVSLRREVGPSGRGDRPR